MGDALTLSYKQTEALMRAMHDIDEERAAALFARFKYLQRMDFPDRPVVGRGSRVGYRFEEVMQLVLVFQLMEIGIAPLRIVRTLRTNWPTVRETLAGAHRYVVAFERDEVELDDEVLVMSPGALIELGRDEPADVRVADPLEPEDRLGIWYWVEPDEWDGEVPSEGPIPKEVRSCCRVVVDPRRIVQLVSAILIGRLALPADRVSEAFDALGAASSQHAQG